MSDTPIISSGATLVDKFRKGVQNPKLAKRHLMGKVSYPIIERLQEENEGLYVVEEDWDNLIVLDACRFDAFECFVESKGHFEGFDIQKRISRGETTARFLSENFHGRSLLDTVYVSANAVVGSHIDDMELYKFVGLWDTDDQGTERPNLDRRYRDAIYPDQVVDATLRAADEHPNKRLIAHFLQPHPPFIVKDGEPIEKGSNYRDFTAVRKGEMPREDIVEVYEENVEYVLEYVQELVEELDGKTVVTADHGELLGSGIPTLFEFLHPRWSAFQRNCFDYAHHRLVRVPELIEVPWVEIDSGNRREIISAEEPAGVEMNADSIEDQLEALGYI